MIKNEMQDELSHRSTDSNDSVRIEICELKYPTFDDCLLDDDIRVEATCFSLFDLFKSLIDVINHFVATFEKLLTTNTNDVIVAFKMYEINFISVLVYSHMIRRKLELMCLLLRKKEQGEIETFHKSTSPEEILSEVCNNDIIRNIMQAEIDDVSSLHDLILNELQAEKIILGKTSNPAVCLIGVTLKYIKVIFERLVVHIETLLAKKNEVTLIEFLSDVTKIETISICLTNCFKANEDNLFNLTEQSDEWMELKKNYQRIIVHSSHTIKKKLKKVFDMIHVSNAAVYSGFKFREKFFKVLGTGYFLAYYFFNTKNAELQSKRFSVNPKFEIAHRVWNLLDTAGIKQLYATSLQKIKFRKKLYVQREEVEINKEYISLLLEKISHNQLIQEQPNEITRSIKEQSNLAYVEKIKPCEAQRYVKIKLLHSKNLNLPQLNKSCLFECCYSKYNNTRDALIIHIHGGGFVAMSSSSHENYLRKWCNKLEVPVISIDYRLAPENPYPKALDDVWQAYNWIIKNAVDEFGIEVNKIILCGDSAGGNLAIGLTYLLIMHNKRLPDALVLAYPGISPTMENFFPSHLLMLQDKILPYHLIKFCIDSYKGELKELSDPFVNTIAMSDYIIKQMPPVRIVVGSSDPLRDDILNYCFKLNKLNKDCKVFELKYFPHGFLNYDTPHMMPEAKIGNDIIIEEIERVLLNK